MAEIDGGGSIKRLHTFSSGDLFELLSAHKSQVVERICAASGVECYFQQSDKSVLIVAGSERAADFAGQILCQILQRVNNNHLGGGMEQQPQPQHEDGGVQQPPKHPWELPSKSKMELTQKASLPHETQFHFSPHNPSVLPSSSDVFGSHLPISRTVSDSYQQQQQQQRQHQQQIRQLQHLQHHAKTGSFAASRRKLESEDSSYDSDHDAHEIVALHGGGTAASISPTTGLRLPSVQISKSHDDISRTPSETLGAEFAEHVTNAQLKANSGGNLPAAGLPVMLMPLNRDPSPSSEQQQHFELENIIRDPNYNSKVEFALRLGYSEGMLQKALMKLGGSAGQNQILEELIRLQKSKPADCPQNDLALTSRLSDSRLLDKDVSSSSSKMAVRSASGGSTRDDDGGGGGSNNLLPIVIDGSNVAWSHGNKEVFSCKGIRICVNWFQSRGHKDIFVFVPKWRKESSKPDTPISDQHILTELENKRIVFFTPSRQAGGKRFVAHDDRYILNLAAENGAVVVSNDNYRELINVKPEYKKVIEEKILMYSFVNDRFMPPDDPLGRNGPSLEQFLRKKPNYSELQPCPYGKKCTYGNKCKFFHADRVAGVPQKSISEKLKESSSQMIDEVRARGSSRDSSPGAAAAAAAAAVVIGASAAADLTRTRSMQPPRPHQDILVEKNTLCRTKSTFPRLTSTQQQQQQPHWMMAPPPFQAGPPPPPPPQARAQHTVSLGPHPMHHQVQQLASTPIQQQQQQQHSDSSNNGGDLWSNPQFMFNRPPPLPDTSLPPPPPRSPWTTTAATSTTAGDGAVNTHKALSRQLTINPTYDPRIHPHHRPSGATPEKFSFPPPNFEHHSTVTRNSSAPETNSNNTFSTYVQQQQIVSQQQQQQQQPQQQQQTQQLHPHLQRMSSTSDSQLHKTLSDMTLKTWPTSNNNNNNELSKDEDAAAAAIAHAAAVSPLIGSSDGVWEKGHGTESLNTASSSSTSLKTNLPAEAPSTSAGAAAGIDHAEARSKLYYHLAAIFPEDQVLRAMRAMPDETVAEKICSYILSLNQQ